MGDLYFLYCNDGKKVDEIPSVTIPTGVMNSIGIYGVGSSLIFAAQATIVPSISGI